MYLPQQRHVPYRLHRSHNVGVRPRLSPLRETGGRTPVDGEPSTQTCPKPRDKRGGAIGPPARLSVGAGVRRCRLQMPVWQSRDCRKDGPGNHSVAIAIWVDVSRCPCIKLSRDRAIQSRKTIHKGDFGASQKIERFFSRLPLVCQEPI